MRCAAEPGQTKTGIFKMLYPGAYVYHCAAAPVVSAYAGYVRWHTTVGL